jgi:hypothetical protein
VVTMSSPFQWNSTGCCGVTYPDSRANTASP